MACGGACEKQIYHFEQGLGATVVHKGTGHPYLSYAEFNEVLKNYFKLAYPEIWLKKCAKGCECVPFFWHVLDMTDPLWIKLPAPIEITDGTDTFTIKGRVNLQAHIVKGTCTKEFDEKIQKPKTDSEINRKFKLKDRFKPKPAQPVKPGPDIEEEPCGGHCERTLWEYQKSDDTKVTPKGKAPALTLNAIELGSWLQSVLRDTFDKDYPNSNVVTTECKCHVRCECVSSPSGRNPSDWRREKIEPNIQATFPLDADPLKANHYIVSGVYEVRVVVVDCVCVPQPDLESGTTEPVPDSE